MDAASNTSTFEPSSDLIQEEDCNTLLVYLPGFTKEQLKVQLTRTRQVKISGRRALPNNRWSSFQKDFPVPENCDTNKISAKFEEGILYVRLPKEDKKIAPAETVQPAEKLPPPPPPKKIDPPPSPPKKIDPSPPRPPTPMRTTGEIKESSAPPKKPVDESTRSAEKSSEAAEGGRKEKRRHTEETIGDRKAEKGGGSGRAEAEYKKLSVASPAARLKVARQQVTNIVVLLLVFGLGIYVGRLPWFSKRPHE